MKPMIGITCFYDWKNEVMRQNQTYVNAVHKAGGIPVLLPSVNDEEVIQGMLDGIDGLLVSGGPDVGAHLFGEEPHKDLGGISPLMDEFEIELIRRAAAQNVPILGICRGEQVLNIALGGTLYQDIYSQLDTTIQHRQQAPRQYAAHSVKIEEDSKLAELLGTEIRVNSYHHQAVKDVAPGLKVVAYAPDRIIEAIESKNKEEFIIGVQWHPEGMWNSSYNYDNLFNEFIKESTKKQA
ncbi:gamma-glutamyl-gamma-aminobutyrate hydrolase family protein [Clostridium sp. 'deep sea']|uniref:gamma-glutamyl-gamma-aminobutyrate hydrolase family protein n=1 Tax=Clostridium sp. 'deep sea' TaxID=2779445 RepID=UPI001A9BF051|nr:gamma-glutamyl-gamma-aminobutyrate hydrolase family protein [Clostridium sp. 'deep sea']